MLRKYFLISTTLFTLSLSPFSLGAERPTLIPRQNFFGNPSRTSVQLSPDGRWLGYIAPSNGVLNVWVTPRSKINDAQVITKDQKRGIQKFEWSEDGKHILYVQDNDGDENWRVYAVDVISRNVKALSPAGKVRGEILAKSKTFPNEILVGANNRDPQYQDVYKANLRTGKVDLLLKNEGYGGFVVDQKLQVRVGSKEVAGGVSEYYRLDAKGKPEAKPFLTIDSDSSLSTSVLGFDQNGQKLMLLDGTSQDKANLVSLDFKTAQRETLATGTSADIGGLLSDPKTQKPQAVAENYLKNEWRAIDPAIQADIDFLNRETKGNWDVTSRTNDDQFWTVKVDRTTESPSFYLYDRKAHTFAKLFSVYPELDGQELAPMYGVEIKARDGLILPALISLPSKADSDHDGKPDKALPLVLYVHGGPWGRDSHGYNSVHQWFANRGLAVLSVNYRGSTGFGKNFLNKANNEFAGAMHNDLIDSINWAVQQGIAQKDKIAIMGGSYGGYATLVGMTFTPDSFACGVDIVGPSNLQTLIESFPAYWQPILESSWYKRVGDPRTAEGKKTLWERSPLSKVDQIKKPLLIGQGANDPRVTQKESDQIVSAMKAKSIPVTYVLYPDEGHGFKRPANRISFNAAVESFLGKCLDVPTEPIGKDLDGSTIQILEGVEHIPGLKEAYKDPKAK